MMKKHLSLLVVPVILGILALSCFLPDILISLEYDRLQQDVQTHSMQDILLYQQQKSQAQSLTLGEKLELYGTQHYACTELPDAISESRYSKIAQAVKDIFKALPGDGVADDAASVSVQPLLVCFSEQALFLVWQAELVSDNMFLSMVLDDDTGGVLTMAVSYYSNRNTAIEEDMIFSSQIVERILLLLAEKNGMDSIQDAVQTDRIVFTIGQERLSLALTISENTITFNPYADQSGSVQHSYTSAEDGRSFG